MEFRNDELGVSFTVPDKITVKDMLNYDSRRDELIGEGLYVRLWNAAKDIIQDWKSDPVIDLTVDIEAVEDPRTAAVLRWAGLAIFSYMIKVETVPKN